MGGVGSVLLYKYQTVCVVTPFLELLEQAVERGLRECRGTTHDPEVFVGTAAYQYVTVVGSQVEYVVVGIEPEEKRHLQFARILRVGLFGTSGYLFVLSVLFSLIDDSDFSVVQQGIGGADMSHAFFKTVFIAGYFVPFTHETGNVKRRHRGVVNVLSVVG